MKTFDDIDDFHDGNRDLLRRATILLTVRATGSADEGGDGGQTQTITISSSVVPRRNVW